GRLPAQDASKKAGAPATEATRSAPEATQGVAPAAEATKGAAPGSELRPNVQFGAGANAAGAPAAPAIPAGERNTAAEKEFHWFAFMSDAAYDWTEQIALWLVLLVAIAGL